MRSSTSTTHLVHFLVAAATVAVLAGCGTAPPAHPRPGPLAMPPHDAVLRVGPFCERLDPTGFLGGPANESQALKPGDRYVEDGKRLVSLAFQCLSDRRSGTRYPGLTSVTVWPERTAGRAPRTLDALNADLGRRCEQVVAAGFDLAAVCKEPARNRYLYLRFSGRRAFRCLAGSDTVDRDRLAPRALRFCTRALQVVTGMNGRV